jgi:hypothetical protein
MLAMSINGRRHQGTIMDISPDELVCLLVKGYGVYTYLPTYLITQDRHTNEHWSEAMDGWMD